MTDVTFSDGAGVVPENVMTTAPPDDLYNALGSPGNILFPFELGLALDQECNIDARGVLFRAPADGIHDPDCLLQDRFSICRNVWASVASDSV